MTQCNVVTQHSACQCSHWQLKTKVYIGYNICWYFHTLYKYFFFILIDPTTIQKVVTSKRAHRAAHRWANIVSYFYKLPAYMQLQIIDKKSSSKCQKCGGCYLKKHARKWVGCDYCWQWWHFNCLGLASLPDEKVRGIEMYMQWSIAPYIVKLLLYIWVMSRSK